VALKIVGFGLYWEPVAVEAKNVEVAPGPANRVVGGADCFQWQFKGTAGFDCQLDETVGDSLDFS
jgi:hypothetical protein